MKGCFFNKKPSEELNFILKVLDCSDVMKLASMYGEARDRFKSTELMKTVDERMQAIIEKSKGKL